MATAKTSKAKRRASDDPLIESDGLLTVNQVAARLCMGRSTIYDLITNGQLRAVKIGRARRIPVSALNRFIADRLT